MIGPQQQVLIIQAMQLPIITLVVLVIYNSRSLNNFYWNKHIFTNKEKQNELSFLFIGLGFVFNFIYILVEIFSQSNAFNIPQSGGISIFFEILNVSFFVVGALMYDKIIYLKLKWFNFSILLFIILILAIENFLINSSILIDVTNFSAFAVSSYFLFKNFWLQKTPGYQYANAYVVTGFMLWTLFQLWPSIGNSFLDENSVKLFGFLSSTIAKSFILFGLYDFSIRVVKSKIIDVNLKNETLLDGTAKFQHLNKMINEIIASPSNEILISKMLNHLINSELFNYDYAIFSKVDNLKGKILHNKNHAKCRPYSDLYDVSEWVREGGISLNDHDILSVAVKEEYAIHVKKDLVNGVKNNFSNLKSILDKGVYDKYRHSRLDRFIIPISNSNEIFKNDSKSYTKEHSEVIGIIELGFNIELKHYDQNEINKNLQVLTLYLNNITQAYLVHLQTDEYKFVKDCIEEFEKDSNHIVFIEKVFKKCAQELNIDKGEISFLSLDNIQMLDNITTIGVEPKQLEEVRNINFKLPEARRKKGIFNFVVETKSGYISNDVETDKYYIPGLENIKSQISIPLIYNETVFGVMNLYSSEKNFFTNRMFDFAKSFLDESANVFLRLKLSYFVSNLVIPYSFYDKGEIYSNTCHKLKDYFSCSFITIWESEIGKSDLFFNKYSTDRIFNPIVDNNKLIDLQISNEGPQIFALNELGKEVLDVFLKRNDNDIFYSLIFIPIERHRGKKRFITILSKRPIENIFPEDKSYINYVINKFILSVTFFDVYDFFDSLTAEKYRDSTEEILLRFMPKLQGVSGADLVLLFIYDKVEEKFIQAITPQGILNDNKILNRLDSKEIERNDFSYSIIKNGTQWIENEKQYIDYRTNQPAWEGSNVFKEDFWYREKIKSLAAVRIEFDGDILGVLFFNYREEQLFDVKTIDKISQGIAIENIKLINLLTNLMGRIIKVSITLLEEKKFLISKTNESLLSVKSEIAVGMIHNIMNISSNLSLRYGRLDKVIRKLNMTNVAVDDNMLSMGESINEFTTDYLIYKQYFENAKFKIEKLKVKPFFKELGRVLNYQIPSSSSAEIDVNENSIKESDFIYGDKIQLSHVIINLVKNAIEASARNISIHYKKYDSTFQYSIIEIHDNGSGIKDEDKQQIFHPSFTTKKDGTGMGLPVSQDVIRRHGGRIDFKKLYIKNKSSGTIFTIYLPAKINKNKH